MPVPLIGYSHFILKTPLTKELQLIQLLLRNGHKGPDGLRSVPRSRYRSSSVHTYDHQQVLRLP